MAIADLTPNDLSKYSAFMTAGTTANMFTAVDASAGATFTMTGRDDKYLIIAENVHETAAKSVTIKAGNGIQGNNDVTVSLAAGKYTAIVLESGRFKDFTNGKITITGGSADIKLAVFKLP